MMTRDEKDVFCKLVAALVAPPDDNLMADLKQEGLRAFLVDGFGQWAAEPPASDALFGEMDSKELDELQRTYDRLFGQYGEKRVSLVESTYKPWTRDDKCGMVFAKSKGLIMGDSAVHILDVYERLSLEVPEVFRSTPDHLILELEFLALLYREGTFEQIHRFIEDHLDWIPDLVDAVERADPDPFYKSAIELIHIFLQNEKKNERDSHEKKKIH